MKFFRLFVAFTRVCFALSPNARAIVPPPDGAYPNFTTAEGQSALQSLTTGAPTRHLARSRCLVPLPGTSIPLLVDVADTGLIADTTGKVYSLADEDIAISIGTLARLRADRSVPAAGRATEGNCSNGGT
jgi:hypothetical protein